jgi:hypothetical protein
VGREVTPVDVLQQVASKLSLTADEHSRTARLLAAAQAIGAEAGIRFDEPARLALANHLAALIRRLAVGEVLQGIDASAFAEIPGPFLAMANRLIGPLYAEVGRPVDPAEVGLVALHFAAAHERMSSNSTGGAADE